MKASSNDDYWHDPFDDGDSITFMMTLILAMPDDLILECIALLNL